MEAKIISILDTSLVFPSPTPFLQNHTLPFSHLDNDPNLHTTVRILRAYAPAATPDSSSPDPLQIISQALSLALLHYYPFAGTLRPRPADSRLELSCSVGQGVPLVHASADRSLASFNYFNDPAWHIVQQLVPDPSSGEELNHPLILQVTVFACGGFSLGMCVHHSMCDGFGGTQFLSAVAELARRRSGPRVVPVWDRATLLGPRAPPRVDQPLQEFLGLEKGFRAYSAASDDVVREWLTVREEWVERYKGWVKEKCGSSFTTFEALGAFIWRARVKAIGVPSDEKVKFVYSTTIRKQIKPELPSGYWGNACVPVYVQMSAGELVEQPVWQTAGRIKESKRNITDEYVRSFIDFQELYYAEGITAGQWVSGFTDWRHLGHSAVDFGWGGPVSVLPLSGNLLGSVEPCFFLPCSSASDRKDGFKVLVFLRKAAVPVFRAEMERFSSNNYEL